MRYKNYLIYPDFYYLNLTNKAMTPNNSIEQNQNNSISTATSMYEEQSDQNIPYFSTKEELLCWGDEAVYLSKFSSRGNSPLEDKGQKFSNNKL